MGKVTQHTEYIAFGEVLFDEHTTETNMPYLFNGKELDSETGLYYYGARYYDARVSLWLNVDPLVEKTMQPYAYTNNNPIMLIDPTGMDAEDCPKCPKPNRADQTYSVNNTTYVATPSKENAKNLEWLKQTDIKEVTLTRNKADENIRAARSRLRDAEDKFWGVKSDAYSISFGGDLNAIVFDVSFNIGIAIDTRKGGEIGMYVSGSSGAGLDVDKGFKPGASVGFSINSHNSFGDNTDVLVGIGGMDQGYSFGLFGQGYQYSESVSNKSGYFSRAISGVETHSLHIGKLGFGGGARLSHSKGISVNITKSIKQKKLIYGK